jgi:aminopeptidase YwaD
MKRTVSFLLFVCLLLLLIPGTALAAPTFNQAVDRLLTQHYPQRVETYLNSLGTSPLGFRLAGTPSDNAAAQYLADRWTAMGLTGVAQEAVPVDVWDVQGAWVRVGGRTLTASQFAGVPGTPADGIKGNVVYLHDGTKQDFDAAGDVTGKIVVVDTALDSYWMNMPGAEATLRGATAIVMTYGPHSGPWYYFANSLGANDGEYDRSWVPIVYVSRADGAWLKSQIAAGSVSATVTSLVTVTMHTSGGVGYNVVGQITGSDPSLPAILINSHHDAHFRPGMDDTGAVATQMTIAKAMKMSGYKPRRTVIFLSTTGEEFGYTDSWYDWSIGAWYAVTNTHAADWPGKLAAMINLELMARKGDPLKVSASTDLSGWVAASAKANSSLLPWGYRVEWPMDTWQDAWTFTAAGVPSIRIETSNSAYDLIYHTTLENASIVDWAYAGKVAKFTKILARKLDGGLLPYNLSARAADLKSTIPAAELTAAGADGTTIANLQSAKHDFSAAAAAYQARKPHILSGHHAVVNAGLLAVEKQWNTTLTGLDVWDYSAYPHQQVLWDIEYLDDALGNLQVPVDKAKAISALESVGLTWNAENFSLSVYTNDLLRHDPSYPLITWAGQVNEAPHLNALPAIDLINADDVAGAITAVTTMRDSEVTELNTRLAAITATLNVMTPMVKALK